MKHISEYIKSAFPYKDNIKQCSKCLEWKPLDKFYRLASSKDGRRPDCKSCSNKPARTVSTEERFWALVSKKNGECWEWMASCHTNNGYGRFWADGRHVVAHNYSWILANSDIPSGKLVCHKCDNPKCVNPNHLFLGTHHDNMIDSSKKGRRGTNKLQPNQVKEIRRLLATSDMSMSKIGKMFGVTCSCISAINIGKTWEWLK